MEPIINRRLFFQVAATGMAGCFVSPMEMFAQKDTSVFRSPATVLNTAKYAIFVLLYGAPSQIDTFDLRVGAWTPADFAPNTINGILWPGGLMPALAGQLALRNFSLVRSCQSAALVHPLVQNWAQIARSPTSALGKVAPNIGSVVALEMESQRRSNQKLPGFVALNGGGVLASQGYFSGKYAPFDVTPSATGLSNLTNQDGEVVFTSRYNTLLTADSGVRTAPSPYGTKFEEMADFYSAARLMMYDTAVTNTFRFSTDDQQRYGNNAFGNACVTARNLIQTDLGTRYIQIDLGGWDHHQNIYNPATGIYPPIRALDTGLANLLSDLSLSPGTGGKTKLDETIIVVKGEFGRSVGNITAAQGRDHYFVHSALVAGGGIRGGRVLGATTPDGAFVEDPGWSEGRPVYHEDWAATIYSALGIDYTKVRTDDPLGRGFEYVPSTGSYPGKPIVELFQ